jgi:hypothetical protein
VHASNVFYPLILPLIVKELPSFKIVLIAPPFPASFYEIFENVLPLINTVVIVLDSMLIILFPFYI